MRVPVFFIVALYFISSCNNKSGKAQETAVTDTVNVPVEKPSFIPVTAYLKGQLLSIREKAINPIRTITSGNKTDSSWLKIEDLNETVAEFLTPVIDSSSMTAFFKEEKFNDQTLNAFTFTYAPKIELPDSITLQHWDVYINPETGNISKIYMVKSKMDTTLQLTWASDQWFSIRTLINKAGGNTVLEKEEKITWKF
ncbi:MAG: hypothetical protein ABJA78_09280 [Ferruginibacter sp.]